MDNLTEAEKPLNRRQRVDAADATLTRAHEALGAAESREMRLEADLEIARNRTIDATKAVDAARGGLAEALTYQDPPPVLVPAAAVEAA